MSYEVWDISPWATAIDEMLNLEEKPEDEETQEEKPENRG